MDLQITKTEARERVKNKITTWVGVPILLWGLFMLVCRVAFIFTNNPELKFSIGAEILPTLMLGYALFSAKDSLITGMIGLLLPRKK